MFGALRGGGDKHLGTRDQLIAGRVMLTNPSLVVAKLIHPLDELKVALDSQGRVFLQGMEGSDEGAEAKFRTEHRVHPEFYIIVGNHGMAANLGRQCPAGEH